MSKLGNPDLRGDAEAMLARRHGKRIEQRPYQELVHELRVHQIELEMQNEELRRAQVALQESRDRYVDLYEFAPVGYFTLTGEGVILEANLTGAMLLSIARESLINRRFASFVISEDVDHWRYHLLGVMRHGGLRGCDLRLKRVERSGYCHARLESIRIERDRGSRVVHTVLTDISERKQAEQELRIAAIAFEAQEGLVITDREGKIQRVNGAFTQLTGYTPEEALGRTLELVASECREEGFQRRVREALLRDNAWQGELWSRRKDGEALPVRLAMSSVAASDGEVSHYVCSLVDISQHKEVEAKLHRLAFYDPLTELPNRRLLLDRLEHAFAVGMRSGRHGALLFIDLDHFKTLNDTKGHDVGDQLLVQVAQRLRTCVRSEDSVARLGGDEFVVMLEELSKDEGAAAIQAEAVGEKIRKVVTEPYLIAGHEYHSTPSIGVSLFSDSNDSAEELLKRADAALYRAKASGRNTLRFFDPAMQSALEAHAALEDELRHALHLRQLQLYCQVQMDSRRRVLGAEVLLRWVHPRRGLVSPAEFIPLAEESGLIVPLGLWVLEEACKLLNTWATAPLTRSLGLAVNVSARQFRQPDFVHQVRSVLERTGADARRLKLELTETLVLDNVSEAIEIMRELKSLGVSFSMDDFGTGQSSLSYLRRLPLDQLKIDESFVRDVPSDPHDAVIVQTIIGMARNLGLEVIAEGVETEAQLAFLTRNGCTAFQGFLFSHPLPIQDFEHLLRQLA